jgi:hypothetical protein
VFSSISGAATYKHKSEKRPIITILRAAEGDTKAKVEAVQEQLLKKAHELKAGIIAIDPLQYDGNNEFVKKYIHKLSRPEILAAHIMEKDKKSDAEFEIFYDYGCGFLGQCKKLGIPHFNAECRHLVGASLCSDSPITLKDVRDSFEQIIIDLSDNKYEGITSICKELEKQFMQKNEDLMPHFAHVDVKLLQKSLFAIQEGGKIDLYDHELGFPRIQDFGIELVDMRILQGLCVLEDCPHIIIVVSEPHADFIKRVLSGSGYIEILAGEFPLNMQYYFDFLKEIIKKGIEHSFFIGDTCF